MGGPVPMSAVLESGVPIETKPALTDAQQIIVNRLIHMVDIPEDNTKDERPLRATLNGYAGTGKTFTIGRALDELAHQLNRSDDELTFAPRIVLAAPTHKALKVLESKVAPETINTLDLEFATIHRLLGLKVRDTDDGYTETTQGGREPSLREFSLALVDESSMIDDDMFSMIRVMSGQCRVVFIGDPAQLPPVNAKPGTISSVFDPEQVPDQWHLTDVMRQADENPILRVATLCRHRIQSRREVTLVDIANELNPGDERFMAIHGGNLWGVAEHVASAFKAGLDVRALAYDNRSVVAVNEMVHGMLHPGQALYVPGEPLMAQEPFELFAVDELGAVDPNGMKVLVQNSETLTVVSVTGGQHHPTDFEKRAAFELVVETELGQRGVAYVVEKSEEWQHDIAAAFAKGRELRAMRDALEYGQERDERQHEATQAVKKAWALKRRFAPIRHAYALTVHKSQGSTFDACVLFWPSFLKNRDVSERNRLAYVALTRTSEYTMVVT